MLAKTNEKKKAIKLRKEGFSYNEILKQVLVSKSTLSLWLRSVSLAREQKQKLTEKKREGQKRGARVKKEQRVALTEKIKKQARKEIDNITRRDLWILGTALYWAEGAKQKEHNVSQKVKFSNSDSLMIKVFLKWLQDICGISKTEISFRISLHETAAKKVDKVKKHWSTTTGFSIDNFQKIDWKKSKINTKRKNIGEKYFGVLNIYIKNSTNLNRKIEGWIEGVCNYCGVVQW